jgi:hypothetical protein
MLLERDDEDVLVLLGVEELLFVWEVDDWFGFD